ncbi:hypothetical protein SAMN05444722_0544 [Rhodovulum sp. ES.010]|uniref:hypothetical protein n=1 Tax=Rhodovulum sp. ES.010 TaxID=1882821 RepID=UPI00092B9A31|nr:hypothetical protein [Rhodovulum sp. ES.010]SIO13120.1 hypothetical protein SAMN05444722_0544 [Rhodovulum sp. ES.010]
MKRNTLCATILCVGMGGGAAFAQDVPPLLDKNADDEVSFTEFQSEYPTATEAEFESLDMNDDGEISEREVAQGLDAGMVSTES